MKNRETVPGNNVKRYKNYDVLRCENCNKVIKVPHIAYTFECPHCGHLHEFVDVEEEENED